MRRFILIYFLKQSVIFHIFTFCEIWRFPLSLLQRWFGPTLVLKPGTVLISDVLTFVSLRVWNWIRMVIWTHRCWVLIFPDASFILFYFILFPLFFYICPFVANILKVSFHQQLHVTLKVLGSLWYLFNILKTNSTTNIQRRFMFLKFGTKTF